LHPTDKLIVDTPEQIALELPIAGIGSRSLAIIIDILIQVIGGLLVIGAIRIFSFPLGPFFRSSGLGLIILLFACLVYWGGYYMLFEIIWNGQTPGKRLLRIRIIKESGRPITAVEAIGRNLVRIVDFIPGFYGIGLVCMFLNKRNKRLGDFIAGTIAVHDKAIEKVSTIWNPGSVTTAANPQTIRISPEELVLIETYLNRCEQLDPPVRAKTASQIAFMIQSKLEIERMPGQSDDDFLIAIARQVRDGAGYR
jgi:uncharacterized RDD family membrane protein YckC